MKRNVSTVFVHIMKVNGVPNHTGPNWLLLYVQKRQILQSKHFRLFKYKLKRELPQRLSLFFKLVFKPDYYFNDLYICFRCYFSPALTACQSLAHEVFENSSVAHQSELLNHKTSCQSQQRHCDGFFTTVKKQGNHFSLQTIQSCGCHNPALNVL